MNCDTCVVMLGRNDKHNLNEFVDTFPYEGKLFLRFYHSFEGPTLCTENGNFLNHILYYHFEYDLVDGASYNGKSYLSSECEVRLKFSMMHLCVPTYDAINDRIVEPSCDLACKNILDDPSVHVIFLYYLFAYDESNGCIKGVLHVGRGIIEVYIVCMLQSCGPFIILIPINV